MDNELEICGRKYEFVGTIILVNDKEFITTTHLLYDNSPILEQLINLKIEYEITYQIKEVN